ncbi:MAG: PilZ domain-containing protein [Myxococcota bacterium]
MQQHRLTPLKTDTINARLSLDVAVRADGQMLSGQILEISRRGIFLQTTVPLNVGADAQVFFYTHRFTALVVKAQIGWCEPDGRYGLLFTGVPAYAAAILHNLLPLSSEIPPQAVFA